MGHTTFPTNESPMYNGAKKLEFSLLQPPQFSERLDPHIPFHPEPPRDSFVLADLRYHHPMMFAYRPAW